jgi:signal transduction histidine kinase
MQEIVMYNSPLNKGFNLLEKQNRNHTFFDQTIPQTRNSTEETEALLLLIEASVDELKQPMAVVLGLSELLLSHTSSDTALSKDLNIIAKEIRRMSEVVRGLNLLTHYSITTSVDSQ